MRTLSDYTYPPHTSVLVRVDYNVPLNGNRIVDTRRIESSYATIDFLLKKKARVLLVAHLGDSAASLTPIARFLSKKYAVAFITEDIHDPRIKDKIAAVPDGTVILLENIRRYPGEEKNTRTFAKTLASLAQVYVNDAFSVSHRKHASVVGVPVILPSFLGFQAVREVDALSRVLQHPPHPFVCILGGAKFGTKIPLLARFEKTADNLIIGGAILNNFYKVAGFEVGKSVVEEGYDGPIKKLLKSEKLLLPVDVVVDRAGKAAVVGIDGVRGSDVIVDIGSESCRLIAERIKRAKLILWNGPMGWYEKGYTKGTVALAKYIASSKARAVIGGGDTGAVIEKALKKTSNKKIFISTAGGATLDFLATGTLPGLAALQ